MDAALGSFSRTMKAQKRWEEVAVLVVSDFGRTLTSNGKGTDHGWGGNAFLLGGAVQGGRVFGRYPNRLTEAASEVNIGRGRFLPTTSWEAVWNALAEWWGVVDANKRAEIMPHLRNFQRGDLFSAAEMFVTTPKR